MPRGSDDRSTRAHVGGLRALAHPLRLRMLALLTGADLSAADVARELGITHANASYHLRLLRNAGLLEVTGREKVRGGLAIRYRHPADAVLRTADPLAMDLVMSALADELLRRAQHRVPDQSVQFSDAELWLTPREWAGTCRRIMDASHDARLAAQPPRSPGTVQVSMTVALFEMTPEGGDAASTGVVPDGASASIPSGMPR